MTAVDGLIIPLEAQDYSVKGTGYVHGLIQKVKKRANPKLEIVGYFNITIRFNQEHDEKKKSELVRGALQEAMIQIR